MMMIIIYVAISVLLICGICVCLVQVPRGQARLPAYEDEKRRRFGTLSFGDAFHNSVEFAETASLKAIEKARRLRAGLLRPRRTEKINREIYSALSIMQNFASADSGGRVTTDALLEQFAKTEGLLQTTYAGVLRFFRLNKKAEAVEYFTSAAGTDLSRDFIMLIIEWDHIEPSKLQKAILSFRSAMKEIRTTELIKRDEILSDLVYLPVIAGVLVIFINFIYIAYFIEQKELLSELFF